MRLLDPQKLLRCLGVYCLAQVGMILLHNSLREINPEAEGLHPALDYRMQGYSAGDVQHVLQGLGPEGRQRYALFLTLDLSLYMWSYAALLSMLLKAAASVSPLRLLRQVYVLPYLAASADAVENCLMLVMLACWPDAGLTGALVPYAVLASKAKWQLLYGSVCAVGGVGFYCVFVAARTAGREGNKGARQQQDGSPQQPEQQRQGQQTGKQRQRRKQR